MLSVVIYATMDNSLPFDVYKSDLIGNQEVELRMAVNVFFLWALSFSTHLQVPC
jgi:hypothetical protein